jgi:hypothetical protein
LNHQDTKAQNHVIPTRGRNLRCHSLEYYGEEEDFSLALEMTCPEPDTSNRDRFTQSCTKALMNRANLVDHSPQSDYHALRETDRQAMIFVSATEVQF